MPSRAQALDSTKFFPPPFGALQGQKKRYGRRLAQTQQHRHIDEVNPALQGAAATMTNGVPNGARYAWTNNCQADDNGDDDDDTLPPLVAVGFESPWARLDALGAHVHASPRTRPWRAPPFCVGDRLLWDTPTIYSHL
ncbi:hypothetical protein pclt_cds_782 [Pandoravirus celtis]|uniref:Uncharacterized protein n=1 Tax=Pandoravirus celtis TaxID=2568002 RepID=A0A4D6EJM7_9VIRU|nr:hypothetical protein pclt_cds_782 [Pandoravirus celtis]